MSTRQRTVWGATGRLDGASPRCFFYVYLATSKNGMKVHYAPSSHAATHFADMPQLKALVKDIVEQTDVNGVYMQFEAGTGRIIGTTDLVETDETDEIIFAKRRNRDTYTRFTKSRSPQPCSTVTVALKRLEPIRKIKFWAEKQAFPRLQTAYRSST